MTGRDKALAGRRAWRKGHWTEALAALYLTAKGYRILERRLRTPVGEIDLVARKGPALVFVEVKARANTADGLDAVTPRSQARIARAAAWYRARHGVAGDGPMRFDVVVLTGRSWPLHLKDAFQGESHG